MEYSMLPYLCYENMLEDAVDLKLMKNPICRSKSFMKNPISYKHSLQITMLCFNFAPFFSIFNPRSHRWWIVNGLQIREITANKLNQESPNKQRNYQ